MGWNRIVYKQVGIKYEYYRNELPRDVGRGLEKVDIVTKDGGISDLAMLTASL